MIVIKIFLIMGMMGITIAMGIIASLSHQTPKDDRKIENKLVMRLTIAFVVMYILSRQI